MKSPKWNLISRGRLLLLAVSFAYLSPNRDALAQRAALQLRADPAAVTVGDSVVFSVSGTARARGVVYEFNFGDGQAHRSSSPRAGHAYGRPGEYTATVRMAGILAARASSGEVLVRVRPRGPLAGAVTHPGGFATEIAPERPVPSSLQLSADRTRITAGESVRFTARSSGRAPQRGWLFRFGDGSFEISKEPTIDHVYAHPGTFEASLQFAGADDVAPATSTVTIVVEREAPPRLALSADRTKVTEGDVVTFTIGSDRRAAYEILFGDGGREGATGRIVRHVYEKAGSYRAQARFAGAQLANVVSNTVPIEVSPSPVPPPRIVLAADRNEVTAGTPVTFSIKSDAPNGSYDVTFGDGSRQRTNGGPVRHLYEGAGDYQAQAHLVGRRDAASNVVPIHVTLPPPTVQLVAVPDRVFERESVQFTARADRRVAGARYIFAFGDGAVERSQGPTVRHTYAKTGTYRASVQLISPDGAVTSPDVRVVVDPIPPPHIALSADRREAEIGDELDFSVRVDPFTPGSTFEFSFGDGAGQRAQSLQTRHAYSEAGTYMATARVIDPRGVTATSAAVPISIRPWPQILLAADPNVLTAGESVRFTASVDRPVEGAEHLFDFGGNDVMRTASAEVEHTYAEPGTFTASVRLLRRGEAVAQSPAVSITVQRPAPPRLVLSVDASEAEPGQVVTFSTSVQGQVDDDAMFVYAFGDGTEQRTTRRATQHSYQRPGTFTASVRLEVDGETLTSSNSVRVPVSRRTETTEDPTRPAVTVRVTPEQRHEGEAVVFSAIVDPDTLELEYRFVFGDSSVSVWQSSREARHTYAAAGTYVARVDARYVQSAAFFSAPDVVVDVVAATNALPSASNYVSRITNHVPWWMVLAGALALTVGAGYVKWRKPPKTKDPEGDPEPNGTYTIHCEPDAGKARIAPDGAAGIKLEVRIRPVRDAGHHRAAGKLVAHELVSHGIE